jgi:hypothetical protein
MDSRRHDASTHRWPHAVNTPSPHSAFLLLISPSNANLPLPYQCLVPPWCHLASKFPDGQHAFCGLDLDRYELIIVQPLEGPVYLSMAIMHRCSTSLTAAHRHTSSIHPKPTSPTSALAAITAHPAKPLAPSRRYKSFSHPPTFLDFPPFFVLTARPSSAGRCRSCRTLSTTCTFHLVHIAQRARCTGCMLVWIDAGKPLRGAKILISPDDLVVAISQFFVLQLSSELMTTFFIGCAVFFHCALEKNFLPSHCVLASCHCAIVLYVCCVVPYRIFHARVGNLRSEVC